MIKKALKHLFHSMGYALKPVHRKSFFGGDGLRTFRIGRFQLLANKNHTIEFNMRQFPFYNLNLPRLARFVEGRFPGAAVVDIGANIGDTAAFIRNMSDAPVICIEGNDYYFGLLEKNTQSIPNVTLIKTYLAEKTTEITGKPTFVEGTSSILEGEDRIRLVSFDDLAKDPAHDFSRVKIIKTDTDGYDMMILRGAMDFITHHKPVLFFEYDREFLRQQKDPGIDTLRTLANAGYHRILFYDNQGRFIVALTTEDFDSVIQMHDYIEGYKAPFEFYDICFFHKDDDEMARAFVGSEMRLNAAE